MSEEEDSSCHDRTRDHAQAPSVDSEAQIEPLEELLVSGEEKLKVTEPTDDSNNSIQASSILTEHVHENVHKEPTSPGLLSDENLSPSVASPILSDVEKESENESGLIEPAVDQLLKTSAGCFLKHGDGKVCYKDYNEIGCRTVDIFKKLNKISEGTYGAVYRAQNIETGEIVALKQIKYLHNLFEEGFPITSLREVNILLELDHPNILNVKEVTVGAGQNNIFMVTEYVEHELKLLLEDDTFHFSASERKSLLHQLLLAVDHLHQKWIVHRDIKTSNLLYSNKGVVKLCDFGMARKYGEPLRTYTRNVVTLWYRAPELLLAEPKYSTSIDMWSVGCVFGELLLRKPIFPGDSEANMLRRIFSLTGTPDENLWPNFPKLLKNSKLKIPKYDNSWRKMFPHNSSYTDSQGTVTDCALDLLQQLLHPCPEKRISAQDALKHEYFTLEKPAPQSTAFMPTLPETNSQARKKRRKNRSSVEQKQRDAFFGDFRFDGRVDAHYFLSLLEQKPVSIP